MFSRYVEDHPHPQENGYIWHEKSGFVSLRSAGSHAIKVCESPCIFARDIYAIRPLILWHVLGAFFAKIGGGGLSKLFSYCSSK